MASHEVNDGAVSLWEMVELKVVTAMIVGIGGVDIDVGTTIDDSETDL